VCVVLAAVSAPDQASKQKGFTPNRGFWDVTVIFLASLAFWHLLCRGGFAAGLFLGKSVSDHAVCPLNINPIRDGFASALREVNRFDLVLGLPSRK